MVCSGLGFHVCTAVEHVSSYVMRLRNYSWKYWFCDIDRKCRFQSIDVVAVARTEWILFVLLWVEIVVLFGEFSSTNKTPWRNCSRRAWRNAVEYVGLRSPDTANPCSHHIMFTLGKNNAHYSTSVKRVYVTRHKYKMCTILTGLCFCSICASL